MKRTALHASISMEMLPALPDALGFAGMYAGLSQGKVFCMGGTNFPDKMPWEGGSKIWSRKIFMFDGDVWSASEQQLPFPIAYGVSVSYKDQIILIGGNNEAGDSNKVLACKWHAGKVAFENYPDLPFPLSFMCGTLVGDLIVLTGGSSPEAPALPICLGLDLKQVEKGWFALPAWPGSERMLPVCTSYLGRYYLFGGETTLRNKYGEKSRFILQDAYCFTPVYSFGNYSGTWEQLAPLPKGVSAGASPLPVIAGIGFVFWGGVDAVTALQKDPATHTGMCPDTIAYHPETDSWRYLQKTIPFPAPVTLPVVQWKGNWLYMGGETKPGTRTNAVYAVF